MMIETMDEPEEMLDLVDHTDTPIGAISRQDVLSLESTGRGFTRAVGLFIMNSRGELWIPTRSEHKKIAPGGLDFSAGEHVGHGESYESAALRGLREELGIEPDGGKLIEVGIVPPFVGMPYFHKIFCYMSDRLPEFNPDDFTGYEWMTPENVSDKLHGGVAAKEILLPSIQLLMQVQPKSGDRI